MDLVFDRRQILKLIAGAAIVPQLPAAEPDGPVFFTKDEFEMLDTLTELIIPADDHSPGAHLAQVAAYIDRSFAEAFLSEERDSWRNGLAAVNELSIVLHHVPFNQAGSERQWKLLERIAKGEKHPDTPAEHFFIQLKSNTAFVYYTSSIGIHGETEYKGNVLQDNYSGYDAQ
jgi:hypothetical protein